MSRRVLVAEDDSDVRDLIVMALEESGYEVLDARDGRQALALLAQPNGVGVLLLDMRMPVMDGWAVAAALRRDAQYAALPVIVLTAAADAACWAQQIGAHAYLSKPFSIDSLRAAVKQFLGDPP